MSYTAEQLEKEIQKFLQLVASDGKLKKLVSEPHIIEYNYE